MLLAHSAPLPFPLSLFVPLWLFLSILSSSSRGSDAQWERKSLFYFLNLALCAICLIKHWCSFNKTADVLVKHRCSFVFMFLPVTLSSLVFDVSAESDDEIVADLSAPAGRCHVFPGLTSSACTVKPPAASLISGPAQTRHMTNTWIHQQTWYLQISFAAVMNATDELDLHWVIRPLPFVAISLGVEAAGVCQMHASPLNLIVDGRVFLCPYSWDLFTRREAGRLNRRAVKSFMRCAVRLEAARNSGSLSNQWVACWALI